MGKFLKKIYYYFFNKYYLINESTGEIHDIRINHSNCHLKLIKNKFYVNERDMIYFIDQSKFDGCRWCMPKANTQ